MRHYRVVGLSSIVRVPFAGDDLPTLEVEGCLVLRGSCAKVMGWHVLLLGWVKAADGIASSGALS